MGKLTKIYKKDKEVLFETETEEYALDKLGITITPQGKHGELTKDQIEFISEFTSWYFSDWEEDYIDESGGVYYDLEGNEIRF